MNDPNAQANSSEVTCYSWAVYGSSEDDSIKIQREVDNIFSDYSFYPEVDWSNYGYRPPEGYQVMGAWRHPMTKVFAFLLDNPKMITDQSSIHLILYAVGEKRYISDIESKLRFLKSTYDVKDEKGRVDSSIGKRIDRIQKKPLVILTSILAIFTAIVNAFSLYLRKLPIPDFGSQRIIEVYNILIIAVHISALFLLLIVIGICAAFLIKYGILIIRRI